MKVTHPISSDAKVEIPLHEMKPGRVVRLIEPNGSACIYMVCRHSQLEDINPPTGSVVVINCTTGRICFKPGHLMVNPLTAVMRCSYYEE